MKTAALCVCVCVYLGGNFHVKSEINESYGYSSFWSLLIQLFPKT